MLICQNAEGYIVRGRSGTPNSKRSKSFTLHRRRFMVLRCFFSARYKRLLVFRWIAWWFLTCFLWHAFQSSCDYSSV